MNKQNEKRIQELEILIPSAEKQLKDGSLEGPHVMKSIVKENLKEWKQELDQLKK